MQTRHGKEEMDSFFSYHLDYGPLSTQSSSCHKRLKTIKKYFEFVQKNRQIEGNGAVVRSAVSS